MSRGGESPVGPAVEPGPGRPAAGSEVPVPALSCETAGKMYPQVSPVHAAAGHCSSLLHLENNRPELGARRLPALLGRGCRGAGEHRGAGEKLPGQAHLWRSFYGYRPLLPPLATSSPRGKKKKLRCTKNKSDPSARTRPGSRGQGQRWSAPSPRSPGLAPAEKSGVAAAPSGGLRQRGRDLRGAGRNEIRRPRNAARSGGAGSSLPGRAGSERSARLPAFPGAFSFANELPGRPSGPGAGEAAGVGVSPAHPLGRFIFPPKAPAEWSWARRCPGRLLPQGHEGRGVILNLSEPLGRCKRECSREGCKENRGARLPCKPL